MSMLSEKMQEALNRQFNVELYSEHLYVLMSDYLESVGLQGFAQWMRVQAQDEVTHAYKFYDFINRRDGTVVLHPVPTPPSDWDSPLAALEAIYQHEQKVTGHINDLVSLSLAEDDPATRDFLQWFIADQVGGEAGISEVIQRLKLLGDTGAALFLLDCELAWIFTPQTPTEGCVEDALGGELLGPVDHPSLAR